MLQDKLEKLYQSNQYPFHMPGHKRNYQKGVVGAVGRWDITEITGFDDAHNPQGILKEIEEKGKRIYKCQYAYPLVQGSTLGIQVAIASTCKRGDRILIQRSCHMSVYHIATLLDLKVSYLWGKESKILEGVWLPDIEEELAVALSSQRIGAVVLTSPDYLGIELDIPKMSQICHQYGTILIVDSAHGAHLGIGKTSLSHPIQEGADLAISSLHKTLPALTQSGILLNNGRIPSSQIRYWIDVFETSSPSYLLLSSIEEALEYGMDCDITKWYQDLEKVEKELVHLEHISVVTPDLLCWKKDRSKLLLYSPYQGQLIKDSLYKQAGIELELASLHYALALTSPLDTWNGYQRLIDGLYQLDAHLERKLPEKKSVTRLPLQPERVYSLYESRLLEKEKQHYSQCVGKVCGEMIVPYPPGIPLVVPGEVLTQEIYDYIKECIEAGLSIRGINNGRLDVIKRG